MMTRVIGPLIKNHYESSAAVKEALYANVVPALEKKDLFSDRHGNYLDFLSISEYSKEKENQQLFDPEKILKLLSIIDRYLIPSPLDYDKMPQVHLSQVIHLGYPKGEEGPSHRDIVGAMLLNGFTLYFSRDGGLSHWSFNARMVPV